MMMESSISAVNSSLSKRSAAERYRAWAANNAEHLREYRKQYYAAHRDVAIQQAKEWADKNPDKVKVTRQRSAAKHIEHHRERAKRYRAENREKHLAATARWRANNAEYKASLNKSWKASNPHKVAASRVERRIREEMAVPKWADRGAIELLYLDAINASRKTGTAHHVDHIVPLRSKFVCGLHCEANLRVLPGPENLRKGNRWWPDMP